MTALVFVLTPLVYVGGGLLLERLGVIRRRPQYDRAGNVIARPGSGRIS